MSQRAEWQRVLDTETRRWSKMSCEQLIAELGDVRAYEVEFESKLYQVEVRLLENTCAYVHVFVAVDAKTDVGHPRRRCGSLYDHPVPGHQPSNQLGRSRRNALAESADSFLQLERRCDSHSRHDPLSEWIKANGVDISKSYIGEDREGGLLAVGTGFPAIVAASSTSTDSTAVTRLQTSSVEFLRPRACLYLRRKEAGTNGSQTRAGSSLATFTFIMKPVCLLKAR
jgi:hypothetical protein